MKKVLLLFLFMFFLVGCDSTNQADTKTDIQTQENENPTVEAKKGTLENPYTVAEALNIIGTKTEFSTEKIYVEGIVTGKPYFNTKYNSYSVYIADSASGKTVQVYSATLDSSLGSAKPEAGDRIVAGGYYTYYAKNSQPELGGSAAVEYPVIYKIIKGVDSSSSEFETYEDDGRATESVMLEFTEANKEAYATVEENSWFWRKDNFVFENSAGEDRIKEVVNYLPYRFYVQSIIYCSVKKGTIKYLEFTTDSHYGFGGDEQITNGKIEVVSNTLTRVYAKKGYNKIRIRNQNDIKNKKQIRVISIKVVYYV